jgi:SAM-dependent methyltransferase
MGFSQEWEQRYAENTHMSIWPWSDLVSLVHRHCKPLITTGGGRVIELGCGAGANIPLFRTLGLDYYAIEGSPTIVAQLHQRYPDLAKNIRVSDFTLEQPFDVDFDVVIDRGSLTCNTTVSIQRALQKMYDSLKLGGLFIGVDWISKNHTDFSEGQASSDEFTKTNYSKGSFSGVGQVHFSDEGHLRDLFSDFEILFMEEKLVRGYEPQDNHQFASWNIVARKPHG